MKIIEMVDGKIGYNNKILFDKLNFSIDEGQFVTILGRTGIGKSSILKTIVGLNELISGEIKIYGDTAMCFQDLRLFPHMDVFDNISYPLKIKKYKKEEYIDITNEILELLNIKQLKNRAVDSLSGGEGRIVALARAIITRPKILLLDEPTSNIDFSVKLMVREKIKQMHNKYNFTTIMVTHDIFDAFYMSDKIMILDDNSMICFEDKNMIKNNQKAKKYLEPFIDEIDNFNKKV